MAAGGQQLAAGVQHLLGVAQVLEHIGAHDGVVVPSLEHTGEVYGFEVCYFHAAVVRPRMGRLGLAEGHTIAGAVAGFCQMLAQCAAAAAQIEHRGALGDHASQHR